MLKKLLKKKYLKSSKHAQDVKDLLEHKDIISAKISRLNKEKSDLESEISKKKFELSSLNSALPNWGTFNKINELNTWLRENKESYFIYNNRVESSKNYFARSTTDIKVYEIYIKGGWIGAEIEEWINLPKFYKTRKEALDVLVKELSSKKKTISDDIIKYCIEEDVKLPKEVNENKINDLKRKASQTMEWIKTHQKEVDEINQNILKLEKDVNQ